MLEKLGLPAKPASRGSAWVIDASHCQSCSSAFSLFNRKHHCRRCGGLFCGNCVQSRMYLRGQGDAPVRICEPCKKIEEASRFEARYGRNKQKKDAPELSSLLNDDSDVASVSGADDIPQVSPEKLRERAEEEKSRYTALKKEGKKEEATKAFQRSRDLERKADALESSIRKSSRLAERAARPSPVKDKKVVNEQEDMSNALKELGWTDDGGGKQNEDELAILGLEEDSGRRPSGKSAGTGISGALHMEILGHKRKALALKREGKLAEAKEELKKAKILEKRLEELEMLGEEDEAEEDDGDEIAALLRSFEKEIIPGSTATTTKKVQVDVDHLPSLDDEKDVDITDEDMTDPDMVAALKAMGWEEEALAIEKLNSPLEAPAQVEGSKARIQAHKRKALELKRSGNLQEAKKELEKAKSLEQMLQAASVPEDSVDETVGEQDMQDPHMLTALKALGFEGGDADLAAELRVKPEDKRVLQQEILSVKRSALALKRQGDTRGASLQLERAKALEAKMRQQEQKKLPVRPPEVDTDDDEEGPELAAILKGLDLGDTVSPTKEKPTSSLPASTSNARRATVPATHKSKRELQGEILGIKRKALVLRREGKVDEAQKELEHVKVLEMQLQALEGPQVVEEADVGDEREDEDEDAEVTEEDLMDPALLAALSAMGFKEDEPVMKTKTDEPETKASAASAHAAATAAVNVAATAAAAAADADTEFGGEYGEIGVSVDIAPPLLSHIGLRTEAEASAGVTQDGPMVDLLTGDDWKPNAQTSGQEVKSRDEQTSVKTMALPGEVALKSSQEMVQQTTVSGPPVATHRPPPKTTARPGEVAVKRTPVAMGPPDHSKGQQAESKSGEPAQPDLAERVLAHKRRALALKRQGDLVAAREELRKAKMVEKTATEAAGAGGGTRGKGEQKQVSELQAQKYSSKDHEEPLSSKVQPQLRAREQESQLQQPSKYTAKDRIKLQQESLGHKRRAMALRREGKTDEAEAEYEKAKLIEKQLEEAEPAEEAGFNDDMTEDVLDPELLAALASVGLKQEAGVQRSRVVVKAAKKEAAVPESGREEKVKALKLRALELKRAGKRREALEALQEAKKLEIVNL